MPSKLPWPPAPLGETRSLERMAVKLALAACTYIGAIGLIYAADAIGMGLPAAFVSLIGTAVAMVYLGRGDVLAGAAAGFLLFVLSILAFAWLGDEDHWNRPNLGIVGLAGNLVWLGYAQFRLARTRHPLADSLGPLLGLVGVVLFFALAEAVLNAIYPESHSISFWTLDNLRTVAVHSAPIALGALGMTLIIVSGGIDLSTGVAMSLSATVLADCLKGADGWLLGTAVGWVEDISGQMVAPALLAAIAIAGCIGCGVLCGLVNGSLISRLSVVPFIVTLGTMLVFVGLGKLIAKETTVHPPQDAVPDWINEMVLPTAEPDWLCWPLLPHFGWCVWLVLGMAVVMAVLLHLTVFGRHVFALGSNEATARLCGIHVTRTKLLVYTIAGGFIGLTGLVQFARLTSGSPTSGQGYELTFIAAVVVGGGSLSGGRGSVVGTLAGAAMMQTIHNGCTAIGISNPVHDIIVGLILITAAGIDQFRQRRAAAH